MSGSTPDRDEPTTRGATGRRAGPAALAVGLAGVLIGGPAVAATADDSPPPDFVAQFDRAFTPGIIDQSMAVPTIKLPT
ncbi:hypothetical protein [Jidongwangia harbinensis]|uniref:hypothetical protein n=1 Tax=Jidongwangia harbinensis TaxID=2878561 RepID=UPI001CDA525D|nr:hypothetical protein [Jidongwangia harbinensis]MCA2217964.1 hypothetical protein [Jidongwangia harbinensis]